MNANRKNEMLLAAVTMTISAIAAQLTNMDLKTRKKAKEDLKGYLELSDELELKIKN